ncbi:hypothetical protein F8B43_5218 [Methylorubrum populi]|uniref:Uncharacterized protein n=1 Tax=Methylorubrum populi TaxID=223967 RepID=A0A833J0S4_9HYPH|nr:hypothetical protein F8B43_5218 [Methylorubrum populi]
MCGAGLRAPAMPVVAMRGGRAVLSAGLAFKDVSTWRGQ